MLVALEEEEAAAKAEADAAAAAAEAEATAAAAQQPEPSAAADVIDAGGEEGGPDAAAPQEETEPDDAAPAAASAPAPAAETPGTVGALSLFRQAQTMGGPRAGGNLREAVRCCERALAALSDELDGGRALAGVACSPKTKAQQTADGALVRRLLFLLDDLRTALAGAEAAGGGGGDVADAQQAEAAAESKDAPDEEVAEEAAPEQAQPPEAEAEAEEQGESARALYNHAQTLLREEDDAAEGNLPEAMRCCKRALVAMSDELDGGPALAGTARSPKTKAQQASDMALTRELLFMLNAIGEAMAVAAEESSSGEEEVSEEDGGVDVK